MSHSDLGQLIEETEQGFAVMADVSTPAQIGEPTRRSTRPIADNTMESAAKIGRRVSHVFGTLILAQTIATPGILAEWPSHLDAEEMAYRWSPVRSVLCLKGQPNEEKSG